MEQYQSIDQHSTVEDWEQLIADLQSFLLATRSAAADRKRERTKYEQKVQRFKKGPFYEINEELRTSTSNLLQTIANKKRGLENSSYQQVEQALHQLTEKISTLFPEEVDTWEYPIDTINVRGFISSLYSIWKKLTEWQEATRKDSTPLENTPAMQNAFAAVQRICKKQGVTAMIGEAKNIKDFFQEWTKSTPQHQFIRHFPSQDSSHPTLADNSAIKAADNTSLKNRFPLPPSYEELCLLLFQLQDHHQIYHHYPPGQFDYQKVQCGQQIAELQSMIPQVVLQEMDQVRPLIPPRYKHFLAHEQLEEQYLLLDEMLSHQPEILKIILLSIPSTQKTQHFMNRYLQLQACQNQIEE